MRIAIFMTHPFVRYWDFSAGQVKILKDNIEDAEICICANKDEFIAYVAKSEIALIWYCKDEWLENAHKLTWIMTPAAGRDYFHLKPRPGITIDYGTFHGEIIGETVVGMMLAEVRGIRSSILNQQAGEPWPREKIWEPMRNLRNSRVTILGFGNIGQWIGKLVKPFGVQITGVKRNQSTSVPYFTDSDRIISIDKLDSVLPTTDHLVLALPSGEDTTDMIDARRMQLLPPQAVIYNIGRGNAIDEKALFTALQKKTIAAAYLDVFKEEPLPADSPLRQCTNLFIMPHASAIAPNYLDLFLHEFIAKYKKKYRLNI